MSAAVVHSIARAKSSSRAVTRFGAIGILQTFVIALWVFPSDYIIRTVGAMGYVAGLVGMFAFAVWLSSSLAGIHDSRAHRNPVRGVLAVLWMVSLASYALMSRGVLDYHQLLGSEVWFMKLALVTGVVLLTSEGLTCLTDIKRVLRVTVWAAAFCGCVAALQFWLLYDPTSSYMKLLPGFHLTVIPGLVITSRSGLNRVSGTGIHPLELGVASALLLPVAIWLAIYDTERRPWRRIVPVLLILVSVMVSVSRAATIAVALAMIVLVVLMPLRQRLHAFALVPVALVGVFATAHGLLGTLLAYFGLGAKDLSITHRTDNYPYVAHLVAQAPFLGQGGGTYIPTTLIAGLRPNTHVLDNQYLDTVIELGVIGVTTLFLFFFVPAVTAFRARLRSTDPELRLLLAALGGACLAATVTSAFWDALSYPIFYGTFALIAGLVGAAWRLAAATDPENTRQSFAQPEREAQ
jgi:hypothetical protein